jgi:hypothetical protein
MAGEIRNQSFAGVNLKSFTDGMKKIINDNPNQKHTAVK